MNLADSQDGLYNPEKAKAEFASNQREALQKPEGFSSNPFGCFPVNQSNKIFVNQVQSHSNNLLNQLLEKIMLY